MKIEMYDGPLKEKLDKCFEMPSDRAVIEDTFVHGPNFESWYEKCQSFEMKSSDVWVVTFPKAGTTWTQEMVWCILNDLESEEAQIELMERVPFIEWDSLFPESIAQYFKISENSPCFPGKTWRNLEKLKEPRTIKSHLHMSLLPSTIEKSKIIYVCRDPRDVCVSYYYHHLKLAAFSGNFDEFFDLFINDVLIFSPFWKHVLEFWERRHDDNIFFIRYEDMKQDLPGMIKKVSKFLGKEISEEYINKLENHLSFENMKANAAVNNESTFSAIECRKDIRFMRNGKVGDWKCHLNESQVKEINKWIEDNLKDSDFPYYRA
ncbi:UNVERIFIED_CONTAM: hypothetical protein RMT77_005207 [Armadillidium vulgare]